MSLISVPALEKTRHFNKVPFLSFPKYGCVDTEIKYMIILNLFATSILLAPVVQKVDNAIHRINHYPLDIAIGFAGVYPLDSDLSGGYSAIHRLNNWHVVRNFRWNATPLLRFKGFPALSADSQESIINTLCLCF